MDIEKKEIKTSKEQPLSDDNQINEGKAMPAKTEVPNAHASGDGSFKRSDEEQNRFPGFKEEQDGTGY